MGDQWRQFQGTPSKDTQGKQPAERNTATLAVLERGSIFNFFPQILVSTAPLLVKDSIFVANTQIPESNNVRMNSNTVLYTNTY